MILTREIANMFILDKSSVKLSEYTQITDDAAMILSSSTETLSMVQLTSLSVESARALSMHQGRLNLSGLIKMEDLVALHLSRQTGTIKIGAIHEFNDTEGHLEFLKKYVTQKKLAKNDEKLNLPNLKKIGVQCAKILSQFTGNIYLPALEEIDEYVAKAFSSFQYQLDVSGLKRFGTGSGFEDFIETALLQKWKFDFSLIRSISNSTAEYLSSLDNLPNLGQINRLGDTQGYLNLIKRIMRDNRGQELSGLSEIGVKGLETISESANSVNLSALESLSLEQAVALTKHLGAVDLSGIRSLEDEVASQLANHLGPITLQKINCLNDTIGHVDLCKKIIKSKIEDGIILLELSRIGNHCAQILGEYPGRLSLPGMTKLTKEFVHYLFKNRTNYTELSGINNLDIEIASEFYKKNIYIDFSGVTKIAKDVSSIFSSCEGCLIFDGVSSIDEETACALYSNKMTYSFYSLIKHIEVLNVSHARLINLEHENFGLTFSNLREISAEAADIILKWNKWLEFPMLETLSPLSASVLSKASILMLDGLIDIDEKVLEKMVENTGHMHLLDLSGLRTISVKNSEILSRFNGDKLWLYGLSKLSFASAYHLSKVSSELILSAKIEMNILSLYQLRSHHSLDDYASFSDDKCLIEITESEAFDIANLAKDGDFIASFIDYIGNTPGFMAICEKIITDRKEYELYNLEKIEPEAAEFLVMNLESLCFWRITQMDVPLAKAFAKHTGSDIEFPELESIEIDVAKELSYHKGQELILSGLRNMSPEIARALSAHTTRLQLQGLKSISVDVANEFAVHAGILDISGIEKISSDVYEILKNHKGNIIFSEKMMIV